VQDLDGVLDRHVSQHRGQLCWLEPLHSRRGIGELQRSRLALCERQLVPVNNFARDQRSDAPQAKASQYSGGTDFNTDHKAVALSALDEYLTHSRHPLASKINDLTIEHIAIQPERPLSPVGRYLGQRLRSAQHKIAIINRRRRIAVYKITECTHAGHNTLGPDSDAIELRMWPGHNGRDLKYSANSTTVG
jgi:hypothetical protein